MLKTPYLAKVYGMDVHDGSSVLYYSFSSVSREDMVVMLKNVFNHGEGRHIELTFPDGRSVRVDNADQVSGFFEV
jgi:hypothetical protein